MLNSQRHFVEAAFASVLAFVKPLPGGEEKQGVQESNLRESFHYLLCDGVWNTATISHRCSGFKQELSGRIPWLKNSVEFREKS